MSKNEKKPLGPNSVDMGERGTYDKRNKLNDLTGKEWVYFTNSVWITGYSPTARENVGLKTRKIHPSPKPPALMKDIIEFFTKSDGKILDPFAGVGGTLLGAALAGGDRKVIGFDLEKKCIPFAFRVYATYEVNSRLSDLKIHSIIDKLNPNLRSIENFNGKQRVREFYAMSPEDAYSILEAIAEIHGCADKLKRIDMDEAQKQAEETAQEIDAEHKERQSPFRFSMCNIQPGEEIEYCNNPEIKCTVVDDKTVSYQGQSYSLSSLAQLLTGSKYSVAGPRYFKYKGEWLNDIRHRLEG